jgi:hypothetical protein
MDNFTSMREALSPFPLNVTFYLGYKTAEKSRLMRHMKLLQALYVKSEIAQLGPAYPELKFASYSDRYCRWRALCTDPSQRLGTEGSPVPVSVTTSAFDLCNIYEHSCPVTAGTFVVLLTSIAAIAAVIEILQVSE